MNISTQPADFLDFCLNLYTPHLKSTELPTAIHFNIFLFCIWYALNQHGRLKAKDLIKIDYKIEEWRSLISQRTQATQNQLEQVKLDKFKQLINELGEDFQEIGQLAHQIEQEFIVNSFTQIKTLNRSTNQVLTDACANIASYFKLKKTHLNHKSFQFIQTVMKNFFQDHHPVAINDKLKYALKQAKISNSDSLQLTFEDL